MSACDGCLRRGVLVGVLAPLIEVIAVDRPGKRSGELLALPDEDLARACSADRGGALLSEARARDLGLLRAVMKGEGIWAICRHDDRFPEALRGDPQAPPVIFGRGDPGLLDGCDRDGAVTIVGARRASALGCEVAHTLGAELAAAGMTVISGMALGIDSKAHEGALGAGGRTLAVLGSGPDLSHPASRRRLYEQIVECGAVISELPPGTRPYRWTFPARNRIMAALGAMTVVVEAAYRSGSLITAAMASDLGREVGAVPGAVGAPLSEGVNALLADGAAVIRGAQDVLDALLGAGAPRIERTAPELSEIQATVLAAVGRGCQTADAVALDSGLGAAETAGALTSLELLGVLTGDSSGRYHPAAARS